MPSSEEKDRGDRLVRQLTDRAESAISLRDKSGRELARALLADLQRAERDLGRRLNAVVDATGGPESSFTAVQMAAYRQQIQVSIDYLKRRLRNVAGRAECVLPRRTGAALAAR